MTLAWCVLVCTIASPAPPLKTVITSLAPQGVQTDKMAVPAAQPAKLFAQVATQASASSSVSAEVLVTASAPGPQSPKTLLVAVCSAPTHFDQRSAIRRTWGRLADSTSMSHDVFFFVGHVRNGESGVNKQLLDEAKQHNDMVFTNVFDESYSNLTRKTLSMISFAAAKGYEAMMKADDDSFVLLDNFIYDVLMYEPERPLMYWGKFWGSDDRPVVRRKDSKFYVSEAEYSLPTFPNYPDGPCYVLGKELLRYIDSNAPHLQLYAMEDAAVGIWLANAPLPVRALFGDAYMYRRECPVGGGFYFVNPVTPAEMDVLMAKYSKREDICSNNFSLAVCDTVDRGCLCSPSNSPCWDKQ